MSLVSSVLKIFGYLPAEDIIPQPSETVTRVIEKKDESISELVNLLKGVEINQDSLLTERDFRDEIEDIKCMLDNQTSSLERLRVSIDKGILHLTPHGKTSQQSDVRIVRATPERRETAFHTEKDALQASYLHFRMLVKTCRSSRYSKFKESFGDLVASFRKGDTWRPTHISPEAVEAIIQTGDIKGSGVQRAHGQFGSRKSRADLFDLILKGEEMEYEKWMSLYEENDKTILLTKSQHDHRTIYQPQQLIEIDQRLCLFSDTNRYSESEGNWLKEVRRSHPIFRTLKQPLSFSSMKKR